MRNITKLSIAVVLAILLVLTSAIPAMGLTTEPTAPLSDDGDAQPFDPDDDFDTVYYFSDNPQSVNYRQDILSAGPIETCQLYYEFGNTWEKYYPYLENLNAFGDIENAYVIFEMSKGLPGAVEGDGKTPFTDRLNSLFRDLKSRNCKIMFVCGTDEALFDDGEHNEFLSYVDIHVNTDIWYLFYSNIFYNICQETTGGESMENVTIFLDLSLSSDIDTTHPNGDIGTSFVDTIFMPLIRTLFIDELLNKSEINESIMQRHNIQLLCYTGCSTFYNVTTGTFANWYGDVSYSPDLEPAIRNDHVYAIGTSGGNEYYAMEWLDMMLEIRSERGDTMPIYIYNSDRYDYSDYSDTDRYMAWDAGSISYVIVDFVKGTNMRSYHNWSGMCAITHKVITFSPDGWLRNLSNTSHADGWNAYMNSDEYAYYREYENEVDPERVL